MHFLFCSQYYYPSVGGVQEVMRQVAERLVRIGHRVTVATTTLPGQRINEWNGVQIEHFAVEGNAARGMRGELERYQKYVLGFPGDAILVKAAQQWTFDALLPILGQIRCAKTFIPCGFSGLHDPLYESYYQQLPQYLNQFDVLVFYAERYRDIDFCRSAGLTNFAFLPNGASETEFENTNVTPGFRDRLGVSEESFVYATVGSITGVKGHREVLEAFSLLKTDGKPVALVLNGARPTRNAPSAIAFNRSLRSRFQTFIQRAIGFVRREGFAKSVELIWLATQQLVWRAAGGDAADLDPLHALAQKINTTSLGAKKVLIVDLPRSEVVDLFKTTDLFVFASNIEYSPLVLFEAAAAGTPFVTVPVGNSEEIVRMTGGGYICAAPVDSNGYTRVDPMVLARAMKRGLDNPTELATLGQTGRQNWIEKYSWDTIAHQYEAILTSPNPIVPFSRLCPTVSVVLPVHNGIRTLKAAILSILAQTFSDFELLVIDDGSTDGTADMVREIADTRVRLLGNTVRCGLAARLNEGIDAASGRYIARMDADDLSFPDRFEKQVQFLKSNPQVDLVGCRIIVFENTGRIVGLHPYAGTHEVICARPWRGFPLPHPSWMGKAAWYRRFRYAQPEIKRAEDQDLLLRSHQKSCFACLDEVLLAYRQGPYNFRKTLVARGSLVVAQERFFLAQCRWTDAFKAIAMMIAKCCIDLIAAFPGCGRLYFRRMAEEVPENVLTRFRAVWDRLEEGP